MMANLAVEIDTTSQPKVELPKAKLTETDNDDFFAKMMADIASEIDTEAPPKIALPSTKKQDDFVLALEDKSEPIEKIDFMSDLIKVNTQSLRHHLSERPAIARRAPRMEKIAEN